MMTRRALAALFLAACTLPAQQDPAAARGRQLLDEALTALGGKAFQGMKDRTEQGRAYSFYRERMSGLSRAVLHTRYLSEEEGGVALRERIVYGKKQDVATVLAQGDLFEVTYRGVKPLARSQVERIITSRRNDILYILHSRLGEPGLEFKHLGTDMLDNRPVDKVEVYDNKAGQAITVFLTQSDHLPVRQEWSRRDNFLKRAVVEATVYSKYKEVGKGVFWPLNTVRERDGARIYEMYAEAVTINQNLPDTLFSPGDGKRVDREKEPFN